MLKTNWGQRDPYNRYCFRRNLVGKKKQALTGCTTTAMSMIVTCNEFPQTLEINGEILDWKGMKTSDWVQDLSDKGQNDVARLMGSIYNSVSKIARPEYTLITPEQIKKRMREFGYDYVKKHSASSLNSSMVKRTSDMLAKGKPVFISAIPANLTRAHSWVIDGAMYSSKNKYNYLLHCNFGWSGTSNGYFSTACLNPARAESYDYLKKSNLDEDYTYSWHFRLVTYDIPVNACSLSITYTY